MSPTMTWEEWEDRESELEGGLEVSEEFGVDIFRRQSPRRVSGWVVWSLRIGVR